jgi:CheY-like chemotaxis protein
MPQKLEAGGHRTGGIAHDFNNLMTAIIGNLELLERRLAGDETAARFLGGAQRAALHGARLTEQLLAFSRRQHLQPCAVDLNAVVGNMRDLLARTIGTAIQVRTNLTPDLWSALIDPTQIEIAILNLAINARDAMPLGGTLTIETRNLRGEIDTIPNEIGDQDCVCLSVQDTGTGMSEAVLRSAIEPFFTTKEVGKGSGLGLSQVYGVVQQSNGCLRIESQLDIGTRIDLYLPRAVADVRVIENAPGQEQPRHKGARILVVDDDPAVRDITVQMLRHSGYDVAEAASGPTALDALSRGEVYDLLVIDIAMPGLNGIETVRRARETLPSVRVLYVTGYAEAGGAGPQIGNELVKKPFRLGEITDAVRRAIADPARAESVPDVQRTGCKS